MATNYFSHDSNARNDEKLIRLRMRHGAAGYGIYFMLLERMRDTSDYRSLKDYYMIAFDLHVEVDMVKSVVEDFGLFEFSDDDEYFYSESFLRRMSVKDSASEKMSEAGKRAMAKRWEKRRPKDSDEPASDTADDKEVISTLPKNDKDLISTLPKEVISTLPKEVISTLPKNDKEVISTLSENDKEVISTLPLSDNNKIKENKRKKINKRNNSTTPSTTRACAREDFDEEIPEEGGFVDADAGDVIAEMQADVGLLEQLRKNLEMPTDQIKTWMEKFVDEMRLRGKLAHVDEDDVRRHFLDWLRIQKNGKAKRRKDDAGSTDTAKFAKMKRELQYTVDEQTAEELFAKLKLYAFNPDMNLITFGVPAKEVADRIEGGYLEIFARTVRKYWPGCNVQYKIVK